MNRSGSEIRSSTRSLPWAGGLLSSLSGSQLGLYNASTSLSSENQCKFIQDRIGQVENHFGGFCTNFAAYARKLSKCRDRGDDLSRSIRMYAENESHNHTTKAALTSFSENFAGVQDYREAQVKRLEDKVIGPLTTYGNNCKLAKERLKAAFAARDKEVKQKKNLDKVKQKAPSDRHQITVAETELQKASVDASRSSRSLEEEMDSFEKQKLKDIKHILMDFVNIELIYHAKALEMYTHCYHSLNTMDEEEDLEEFRNSLRPATAAARLELQRAASKNSLNTTMNTTSASQQAARPSPLPPRGPTQQRTLNSTMSNTAKGSVNSDDIEDDDDDDDDDDEEEEESDEDDEYERGFQRKPNQK